MAPLGEGRARGEPIELEHRNIGPRRALISPLPRRPGSQRRERSPERVIAEVRHLKRRYGVRGIAFRDPLFNLDRARTTAIADGTAFFLTSNATLVAVR